MKPSQLEKLLQQEAPPPDPAARLATRRAALEEFARTQATANEAAGKRVGLFRALLNHLRRSRTDSTPWYSQRDLVGGAASVVVALIGVAVVWNTLREHPEITEVGPVAAASPAAESPTAPSVASPASAESTDSAAAAPAAAEAGSGEVPAPARLDVREDEADFSSNKSAEDARRSRAETLADEQKGDEHFARAANAPASAQAASPADVGPVPAPAAANQVAAANGADSANDSVVVTGRRGSRQSAQEMKREATGVIDESTATQAEAVTGEMASISKARGLPQDGVPPLQARRELPALSGNVRANIFIPPDELPPPVEGEGRDRFEQFEQSPVKRPAVQGEEVSTFSADVDTSSYSFVRKKLSQGVLPPQDAVRAEEMINYFDYAWPAPASRERPFQPTVVVSDSPWGKGRKLIHIGIKGYELLARERPDANLVMLLDVSGSMNAPDKLPLVKQSMKMLLDSLKPTDTVAIVVYASAEGLVLPTTPVSKKKEILAALDRLTPGGSTAGAAGIALAYDLAERSFRKDGVNRILLCTDGDFNVGIDSTSQLKGFVERKREKGVFLSVLGFGQGNYRDELAQALAQNGNGVAAYIDTINEAQKVLVQEAGASLFTIARDVKLQVEFNPATVAEYRLVGYETRALKREDFDNDAVDAGDVGAGHTVTAIYEITPVDAGANLIGESRYGKRPEPTANPGTADEYGFLKIRYKLPKDRESQLIRQPINIESGKVSEAIERDVQFSTAVAGFAQLLRGGKYTGALSYEDVIKQALATRGDDPFGYRNEFVQLVRRAQVARGM